MKYKPDLQSATLIRRYKRFLADIRLPNGQEITIHCPNTGRMTGCATEDDTVWYSTSSNTKRKYPQTWELTQTQHNDWICVNTLTANGLIVDAIENGIITELLGYTSLRTEVKYGNENSRIDILLSADDKPDCYIEVKSVTLYHNGIGSFPDAITQRGQKHIRELIAQAESGKRAVLMFAVLHSAIERMEIAGHIDSDYLIWIQKAEQAGVEILAYKADVKKDEIKIAHRIKFNQ